MERIRASFRSRATERAATLRAAALAGDREQLRQIAHNVCGTGGTLGFLDTSDTAMHLEDLIDNEAPLDEVRQAAEVLANALAELALSVR